MEKRTPAAKPTTTKPTTKAAKPTAPKPAATKKAATPSKDIPAEAVAKLTKWNEAHPDMQFSWIVIDPKTPLAQRTCTACKREFRDGRVTRLTTDGHAVCGPVCQRKAQPAKK